MFTLLFQTVSASLICPVMPSVHSRWNICGIICFKSFKNDHLKNPVSPQLFCCSKSLHDANMVVRLSFVVFLWLLGRWVKVGKGAWVQTGLWPGVSDQTSKSTIWKCKLSVALYQTMPNWWTKRSHPSNTWEHINSELKCNYYIFLWLIKFILFV